MLVYQVDYFGVNVATRGLAHRIVEVLQAAGAEGIGKSALTLKLRPSAAKLIDAYLNVLIRGGYVEMFEVPSKNIEGRGAGPKWYVLRETPTALFETKTDTELSATRVTTCADCGTEIKCAPRGRPRRYCDGCRNGGNTM